MDNTQNVSDVLITQQNAKAAFNNENYSLACAIYEKLWEQDKSNQFLLSYYGRCLRKLIHQLFLSPSRLHIFHRRELDPRWIAPFDCWSYNEHRLQQFSKYHLLNTTSLWYCRYSLSG